MFQHAHVVCDHVSFLILMINNTNTTYKSAHRRKIIIAYVEVTKNVLRSITYLTKNIFLQAQDAEIAGYSLENKIKKRSNRKRL